MMFARHTQIRPIAELDQTRNFGYDNVNRLTSMTNGTSSESYTFDGVGNRTASHLSATYSYQPFNRMTATATATMSYDSNGNLATKSDASNSSTYTWDYENRMTSAANASDTVHYSYDALGRRVERYTDVSLEDTKFTYDGLDVVMDDDVTTGVTKYQNGPGIDNKLSLKHGGVTKYFLADHLGSSVALTDSSGAVTEQISYDSFGNGTNASFSSRYQFTGRDYDSFSQLYYYRARSYDSNLGRFVSEDPIGFMGGDVNVYGYVRNQPQWYRDPLGLQPGADVLSDPNTFRNLLAAGGALVAAVPAAPIAIGVGGAAAIYGAAQVGSYSAAHPWNPVVNGPWPVNPWKPPLGYPSPSYPPTSTSARLYCQPGPQAIPFYNQPPIPYPIPLGPYPPQTPEKQEECYQKCQHLLGIGDYGVQFNACFRRCTGRID